MLQNHEGKPTIAFGKAEGTKTLAHPPRLKNQWQMTIKFLTFTFNVHSQPYARRNPPTVMKIEQFEDKNLAQFSYILMSDAEIAVIDPARDPKPYEEYAMLHDAKITAIIETHPHADFVSGHLELSEAKQTPIYVSSKLGATYKHTPFNHGDELKIGNLTLRALETPGHSPDSISVLVLDENGKEQAVFTGDALLLGDVGRPDLRETVGHETSSRDQLARQMYHTTREIFMKLPDDVLVYPAHGAGSLCGKSMSKAKSSTIGEEKATNAALQPMTQDEFVTYLTSELPFVPKYFGHAVELNRTGAPKYDSAIKKVPILGPDHKLEQEPLVIDTRPQDQFRQGHLDSSINLPDGPKFETWLGSVVWPDEPFYLIARDEDQLRELICRTASIGYEGNIRGAILTPPAAVETAPTLDLAHFKANPDHYTILDIRNTNEVKEKPIFANALAIPLPELREHLQEVPTDKPIVVHCASGYRSAVGASILTAVVEDVSVYDLGDAVTQFMPSSGQA
ncbi:rhodanese-like domain-containing protein [Rufibacter sp. LB8]|uniref:MBL fold metallo-hydrolase n=3 Tax=Rufibacter sp. LB8 TaxID=2777781 RepID=UPI00351C614A